MSMLRRIFPHPFLWLALLTMWLLLSRSTALAQLLLGGIVASLSCWAVSAIEVPRPKIRRFALVLRLLGLVIVDIIRSNLAVIRLVLGRRKPRSVFVAIPLELREPNALAVLACIITATPGSAWINHNSRANTVLVHVLDTEDETAWADMIKRNYEALLLEIFQ